MTNPRNVYEFEKIITQFTLNTKIPEWGEMSNHTNCSILGLINVIISYYYIQVTNT